MKIASAFVRLCGSRLSFDRVVALRVVLAVAPCFVSRLPAHAQESTRERVHAPPEADVKVEAQRAMELGVAASARGDHEAALAQYLRAQALVPEANLPYRFAGEAYEKLARYDEAVASYTSYLRARATVRDADTIRARIVEIRTRHLEGVLDVVANPAGSAVFLDGSAASLGDTPLRDVAVRAGEHTVRVRYLGYREAQLTTRVVAGAKVVLQCELERLPPLDTSLSLATATTTPPLAPSTGVESNDRAPSTKPWFATWWVWTGAGAVVAAGVVTAIVLAAPHDPPATQGGVHRFPSGS